MCNGNFSGSSIHKRRRAVIARMQSNIEKSSPPNTQTFMTTTQPLPPLHPVVRIPRNLSPALRIPLSPFTLPLIVALRTCLAALMHVPTPTPTLRIHRLMVAPHVLRLRHLPQMPRIAARLVQTTVIHHQITPQRPIIEHHVRYPVRLQPLTPNHHHPVPVTPLRPYPLPTLILAPNLHLIQKPTPVYPIDLTGHPHTPPPVGQCTGLALSVKGIRSAIMGPFRGNDKETPHTHTGNGTPRPRQVGRPRRCHSADPHPKQITASHLTTRQRTTRRDGNSTEMVYIVTITRI